MSGDACATPGCGHGAGHHRNYTGPCGMGNDACPCTAYLRPRPVPEEAQVSSPGPASDLISHAAGVILQCMDAHPGLTAPGHWAGALWKAGMLVHPGTADTTSLPATVPAPHAEAEARADAERFLERVVAAGEVVTAREAYIAGFIAGYLKGRGND